MVSTGSTGNGGIGVAPSAVCSTAPADPSVTTTARTPRPSSAGTPPSSSTSCSLGTTTSHSPSSDGGSVRAGAGFSTVVAPAARASTKAASTVCSGTSSWASTTRHGGSESIATDAFAPGTTMIEFSPASLTPMSARPVGVPATTRTPVVSTPSAAITPSSRRPASSSPTADTNATRAPARAEATAWFSPLPPGCSA
ncbi:unannotated protein [freshwater metagenome]|uniref:Unannotated protein n=1 Tax=freshwater metagenome TaxID=449393 RepID=A0A6J6FFB2_9ZZZZ